MTFMDIHNYIHIWILGTRSYFKKYPQFEKICHLCYFTGKPVMAFSVLAAQACINGTKEIKHFSDHQLLLPFPASLLVPTQNPTGVKLERAR